MAGAWRFVASFAADPDAVGAEDPGEEEVPRPALLMRLLSHRTAKRGVIALDWWWPEAGFVLWVGGEIRWKMWGRHNEIP